MELTEKKTHWHLLFTRFCLRKLKVIKFYSVCLLPTELCFCNHSMLGTLIFIVMAAQDYDNIMMPIKYIYKLWQTAYRRLQKDINIKKKCHTSSCVFTFGNASGSDKYRFVIAQVFGPHGTCWITAVVSGVWLVCSVCCPVPPAGRALIMSGLKALAEVMNMLVFEEQPDWKASVSHSSTSYLTWSQSDGRCSELWLA